jgi:hypothetical protein
MIYYHRLKSRTQTDEDAALQLGSQEMWGRTPFNGLEPKVQAYTGRLPAGEIGIEFTTNIPPDNGCTPTMAAWSGSRDDVKMEDGFAKIPVTITDCTQNVDI